LPRGLRDTPIVRDPSLAGSTIRVHYTHDDNGRITGIEVRVGDGAQARHIADHVNTIRTMQGYQGLSGRARAVLARINTWLTGHPSAGPGTLAWETRREIEKLNGIIDARTRALDDPSLTAAQRADLERERADYEGQLARYEAAVSDLANEPGRGYVAAADSSAADSNSGRGGATDYSLGAEAAWRLRYLKAEKNYHWRLDRQSNPPRVQYRRSNSSVSSRAYDAVNRQFVDIPDNSSPTTIDAIREGYPPPPADHHYYRDSRTGDFQLGRTDAGFKRNVTLMEVYRTESGTLGIRPREARPLITRRPYRTDIDVGNTEPSDFDSAEYRAEFRALVNERDQALREREAAHQRLQAAAPGTPEHERLTSEHNVARNAVGIASRDLGTFAADAHVRRTWPGAERVYPAEGAKEVSRAGDFDLVYKVTDKNGHTQYVVVEAKGGSSPLGSRHDGHGNRVQQGTQEYYELIVQNMVSIGGSADRASDMLRTAPPGDVIYLHSQVDLITSQGDRGELVTEVTGFHVNAFDISRPGIPPTPPPP